MVLNDIKGIFMAGFEKRLMSIYRQSLEGLTPSKQERLQFEGYMDAGIEMGVVDKVGLQSFIDEKHSEVFGQTIRERGEERKRKEGLNRESSTYESYEVPAWIRRGVNIDL